MINQSSHHNENCTGNTDWTRTVDAIYESGIAWFNSMGNAGHTSVTTCNAGAEAAALGGFAISAITFGGSATTSVMYGGNSRGGVGSSPANGRNRAIVGITAPTNFEYPYAYSASVVDGSSNPLTYGTDWTVAADGVTLQILGAACDTLKASATTTVAASFPCGSVIF